MKELFDLDPTRVQPDAKLIDDLDLDSIDAIDLAAKVEETTGHTFDEAHLRRLRTIDDVIIAIESIVAKGASSVGPVDAPEGGAPKS